MAHGQDGAAAAMTALLLKRICDHYPDVGWQRSDDQWLVVAGDQAVGSIGQQLGGTGRGAWQWSITWPLVPQPAANRGVAPSLGAAQAAFRARWDVWEAAGFDGATDEEKRPRAGASGRA